jgi:heterodisulfide reductase subunit B
MKYAYFPGCSQEGTSKEYEISNTAVSKVLGVELEEIPDWNCCGSIDAVYASNPILSLSLSARNLALAEKMGMDVVTLCSGCYLTLARANRLLNENADLKDQVNVVLGEIGLKFDKGAKVRHIIDVFVNDVGLKKIADTVKVPLKGLKVAPYYGCMYVRSRDIAGVDDYEHPVLMDRLVEALGATNVVYPAKTRCCGASLMVTKEKVAFEMSMVPLVDAKNAEANCIATFCPFCQFNLDARQKDIEEKFKIELNMPVLHITQLMGLAFGLKPGKLGLKKNCVYPKKILAELKI